MEEKIEQKAFTEWFKDLRISNGFSQPKMAKAIGVSYSTIYNLENGNSKLTPSTMLKISKRFNIPIEEIRKLKGVEF